MSLSVGIEIEAVAVERTESGAEPLPTKLEQQLQLVANALRDARLPAQIYIPSTTRGHGPDYTVWNVTTDITVSEATSGSDAGPEAFRERFGFELISPVFDTGGDEWKAQVELATKSISKLIKWKGQEGESQYRPPCARRGRCVLDEFPPHHRFIDNENILSIRNNELLRNLDIGQIYKKIQGVTDLAELCQLVNHCETEIYDGYGDSRFFKVNFTSLLKHNTIEFRQHEGMTDPVEIIRWVRFVALFVELAISFPLDAILRVKLTRILCIWRVWGDSSLSEERRPLPELCWMDGCAGWIEVLDFGGCFEGIILEDAGAMHVADALQVWGTGCRPCAMGGDERPVTADSLGKPEKRKRNGVCANMFSNQSRVSVLQKLRRSVWPCFVLSPPSVDSDETSRMD